MKRKICAVTIICMSLVVISTSATPSSPTPSSTTPPTTTPSCPRKEHDGVFHEPQNRECMKSCHPRKQKRINWVCGEQKNPPKHGRSTATLYINECERRCDTAKPADIKMCKNQDKKYRTGPGQLDRGERWDCEEEE